ncbi:MAG: ThuA domain-containing protein [Thermoguttaceae bacterium]
MCRKSPLPPLRAAPLAILLVLAATAALAEAPGVVLQGKTGPAAGKHVVLVAADDEYRSEELIPQLAKILAVHHGCKCTLLFAVDPRTGFIDPGAQNIPGLEALDSADVLVIFARFRELPDEQMKHFVDYLESGKPILALRTATHAFNYTRHTDSPYAKFSFNNSKFSGGFGRQVLGETWIDHYGHHNVESTRATIAPGMERHPIVRGVGEIWGPSDVYAITTLTGDSKPLLLGHVLTGMKPTDPPNEKKAPVPVAWTKTYAGAQGKTSRVFTTTMGHCDDLKCENFRRLLVNACYWCMGLEDKIPAQAKVDLVGAYDPNPIHGGGFKKNVRPSDYRLSDTQE